MAKAAAGQGNARPDEWLLENVIRRFPVFPVVTGVLLVALVLRAGSFSVGIATLLGSGVAVAEQAGAEQAGAISGGDGTAEQDGSVPGEDGLSSPGDTSSGEDQGFLDPTLYTPSEVGILTRLSRRREEIEARAREVERQASLLDAASVRLERRIGELRALEARLLELRKERQEVESQRFRDLAKIYETMKPGEAAAIIDGLGLDEQLEIAAHMTGRKVAPVLAAMKPASARVLTRELLARARNRPLGEADGEQGAGNR